MKNLQSSFKLILMQVILFCFALLITSCGKKEQPANQNQNQTPVSESVSKGRYKIKSGIVNMVMKNNMMNMNTTSILYFDDYGKKECRESTSEIAMMGRKIKTDQLTIFSDGYVYSIDLLKKTGIKRKLDLNTDPSKFDYSNLSEQFKKDWNVKKEGTETFLGKDCDVYTVTNEKMKSEGKSWIWQGIALKYDMTMGSTKVSTEATKFEENASIPSSRFEVPEGIQIREINTENK